MSLIGTKRTWSLVTTARANGDDLARRGLFLGCTGDDDAAG
jgi:hypothetical protein